MGIEYKKEFFDREYSLGETYGRVWKYARRYWLRIFIGIVTGMLTAGTLLPIFQVVQPAVEKVSANEAAAMAGKTEAAAVPVAEPVVNPEADGKPTKLEREMAAKSRLPSWYPKAEKLARKCGIDLQTKEGGISGALLLIAVFVIPLVAAVRFGLLFLSQYCLAWAGTKVVADLRVEILRKIQEQSLQFHGRIDVGQLMTRATVDPQMVQAVIQNMLAELARAPFEILVSAGFIIWFAVKNQMMPTLVLIAVGMPAFMLPVVALGKVVRKWSLKSLQRNSVVGQRVHEILTCIRVVKAYDTEDFENAKYGAAMRNLVGATMRSVRWTLMVAPMVETVGILLLCGFLVWCFTSHVTLANVLPMLAPLLLIYKPVKQMSSLQVSIEVTRASLQRICGRTRWRSSRSNAPSPSRTSRSATTRRTRTRCPTPRSSCRAARWSRSSAAPDRARPRSRACLRGSSIRGRGASRWTESTSAT